MHILNILTLFASLATASPISARAFKFTGTCPAPPPKAGVFFCLGNYFEGNCSHLPYTDEGWCGNFPDIESRPQSIGPDQGGYCIFFNKIGCGTFDEAVDIWRGTGKDKLLQCPGIYHTGNPNWFMSMKCMKTVKPIEAPGENPSGGEWKGNEGLQPPGER